MSTSGDRPEIKLEPGSPVAQAVADAEAAFARANIDELDHAYAVAVDLTDKNSLRQALAADHVARLLILGALRLALERCAEYLGEGGGAQHRLHLLRAEIYAAGGAHRAAAHEAAQIRKGLRKRPAPLSPQEEGRLLRVEGLAAAELDDVAEAHRLLAQAMEVFARAGLDTEVATITRDRLLIDIRQGTQAAVQDVLADPHARLDTATVADRLLLAAALTRELRYEEALRVLKREDDLDPALRLRVLSERAVLLHLTRQDEAAAEVIATLKDAAADALDPASAQEILARFSPEGYDSISVSSPQDDVLQKARMLIEENSLDAGADLLLSLRDRVQTAGQHAFWQLAWGELNLARHRNGGLAQALQTSIDHLVRAVELASGTALLEIQILALRTLGRALARDQRCDQAARCWARAHQLEEDVAGRQISDDVRIGMLLEACDEHDERIRAAAEAWEDKGIPAAPGLLAAMDAARGATLLGSLLPLGAAPLRPPERIEDGESAWAWLLAVIRDLPRDQVIWLMHAAPKRVHHLLVGHGLWHYAWFAGSRRKLASAVTALTVCWDHPAILESSIGGGEFDQALARIRDLTGIALVLPSLPDHITRAAFVAGGELADIPFAAIAVPGPDGQIKRLGHRVAVSDLPGLSVRQPLHQRSGGQRGENVLLLNPVGADLTAAAEPGRGLTMRGPHATVAQLSSALATGRYHQVRIDGHGTFDESDPSRSWLQLAPAGEQGRLHPDMLQEMDLHQCGTLILGACESGMAQRRGRDEAAGFVRAAMTAGAASVVAARWVAEDTAAAAVLDLFQSNLRHLPRDVALQRAQRDVAGRITELTDGDHPARWACWTLYGDAGWQTPAGSVRRRLRRQREQRRTRVSTGAEQT